MEVSSKFWETLDAGTIESGQTVVVFRLKNNSNKLQRLLHACTVPPRPGFEFSLLHQGTQAHSTNTDQHSLAKQLGPPLPSAGVDIAAGSHIDIAVRIGERHVCCRVYIVEFTLSSSSCALSWSL